MILIGKIFYFSLIVYFTCSTKSLDELLNLSLIHIQMCIRDRPRNVTVLTCSVALLRGTCLHLKDSSISARYSAFLFYIFMENLWRLFSLSVAKARIKIVWRNPIQNIKTIENFSKNNQQFCQRRDFIVNTFNHCYCIQYIKFCFLLLLSTNLHHLQYKTFS